MTTDNAAQGSITQSGLRKVLGRLALAAATIGTLPAAQAALVTGRFDPAFGAALNGVGYRGTATFSINDACLSLGGPTSTATGAFVYAAYDCNGAAAPNNAGMSFLGAQVEFYDLVNTSLILGTVSFTLDASAVLGMYVQNNQVTGIQTKVIGAALSDLPPSITVDPFFFLQFGILGYDSVDPCEVQAPASPTGYGSQLSDMTADKFQVATMYQQVDGCVPGAGSGCVPSNPATANYVPEPGSMALALGALVAGWSARRRRG